MSEEGLLNQAFGGLPEEYNIVIAKLKDSLCDPITPLTIKILHDKLSLQYEKIKEKYKLKEKNTTKTDTITF